MAAPSDLLELPRSSVSALGTLGRMRNTLELHTAPGFVISSIPHVSGGGANFFDYHFPLSSSDLHCDPISISASSSRHSGCGSGSGNRDLSFIPDGRFTPN